MADPETESGSVPTKPGHGMKKIGGSMVVLCVACLIIGRAVVSIFFPDMKGKGVPSGMWPFLITIWSIGIIGLLLLLVGWVRGKIAGDGEDRLHAGSR